MRSNATPHTEDWFRELGRRNPERAAQVWQYTRGPVGLECCSRCGSGSRTENYTIVQNAAYPVPTLRLCEECREDVEYRGLVRGPHPLPPAPRSPVWLKRGKAALRGYAVPAPKVTEVPAAKPETAASAAAPETPKRKRGPMFNQYPGYCSSCQKTVPKGHGRLYIRREPAPAEMPAGSVSRKVSWEIDCKPRHALHTGGPRSILVLRTAARKAIGQYLLFGFASLRIPGEPEYEFAFYGPDLSEPEVARLRAYVATRARGVELKTLDEFLTLFHDVVWEAEGLFCRWGLASDLARMSWRWGSPKSKFYHNGFTLNLFRFRDQTGKVRPDSKRFTINVKSNESATLIRLCHPDDSNKPKDFRGHPIELSDLATALSGDRRTPREVSLLFGASTGPAEFEIQVLNEVTDESIARLHAETRALVKLSDKLLEEYNRHRFQIPVTKLHTAARIPKEYLTEAGITPPSQRQEATKQDRLNFGRFANTIHGGNLGVGVRQLYCPVLVYDFTNAYAWSFILQDLKRFLYAERINLVEGRVDEITRLIDQITHNTKLLLEPETWNIWPQSWNSCQTERYCLSASAINPASCTQLSARGELKTESQCGSLWRMLSLR
jgi:hypothetical protein